MMPPIERRHRHDRARTLHTRLSRSFGGSYQVTRRAPTGQRPRPNEPRSRWRTPIVHQDLRVVVRIIQSRADARSPGQQRAAERNKQSRSDHCAELGLLPPRPGRRGHMARALHHAGRGRGPVIGAALGRGPHRRELGRRFAQVHASCKNGTRGWWEAAPRPSREGSGADGSRPGRLGRVFSIFKLFGSGGI